MQGIFRKENTDKALKYGIYRHLPTYEKIIRNLVSFYTNNTEKSVFMSKKIKKSSKRIQNVVFSLKRHGKQEKKEYGIAD